MFLLLTNSRNKLKDLTRGTDIARIDEIIEASVSLTFSEAETCYVIEQPPGIANPPCEEKRRQPAILCA